MQVNAVNPYYPPQPAYGQSYPQPVTYTPYSPYSPDMYSNPMNPAQQQQPKKEYVTKQSVAMGIAGAGIGFLIGGPMGALIGGLGALLLGILINLFSKPKQPVMPNQGQMPAQPYYPYPQAPQQGYPQASPYQSNYDPYQQMQNPYGQAYR